MGVSRWYVYCQLKSQSSIRIRSCTLPSGNFTEICMSCPSRCMCGETLCASDVNGHFPRGLDLDDWTDPAAAPARG